MATTSRHFEKASPNIPENTETLLGAPSGNFAVPGDVPRPVPRRNSKSRRTSGAAAGARGLLQSYESFALCGHGKREGRAGERPALNAAFSMLPIHPGNFRHRLRALAEPMPEIAKTALGGPGLGVQLLAKTGPDGPAPRLARPTHEYIPSLRSLINVFVGRARTPCACCRFAGMRETRRQHKTPWAACFAGNGLGRPSPRCVAGKRNAAAVTLACASPRGGRIACPFRWEARNTEGMQRQDVLLGIAKQPPFRWEARNEEAADPSTRSAGNRRTRRVLKTALLGTATQQRLTYWRTPERRPVPSTLWHKEMELAKKQKP